MVMGSGSLRPELEGSNRQLPDLTQAAQAGGGGGGELVYSSNLQMEVAVDSVTNCQGSL